MKVQIKGYALYVEDGYGNDWTALVTDMSDTVSIYGLKKVNDKEHWQVNISFESEAHHLSAFAKTEGLKYVSKEVTVTIEVD